MVVLELYKRESNKLNFRWSQVGFETGQLQFRLMANGHHDLNRHLSFIL